MAAVESDDEIIVIPEEHLALMTDDERDQYRRYLISVAVQRDEWEPLLQAVIPSYASVPFGDHHRQFWNWAWQIEKDTRPDPFVAIWPRGGAKSTTAEMAVAMLGARGKRGYCLYVSETQDQADDHVANIAAILESPEMSKAYPEMGERLLSKFGTSKGWKVNRLRTSSGFTVDAVGLEGGARGIKLDEQRPDLMVLDDIDGETDGEAITAKKIKIITRKLIPAGSATVATIAIQNMVHENSIFAKLADGSADFLKKRIVSGPIPAIWNMEYAEQDGLFVITGGTPSWPEGQGLEVCQSMINDMGITAFLAECQHRTVAETGGMFDHINFGSLGRTEAELPSLRALVIGVDPAVTATDRSDCMGVNADALGADGKVYRLFSWEARTSPLDAMRRAILKAIEWGPKIPGGIPRAVVVVETNQGGDTWKVVFDKACEDLREEGKLVGPAPKYREEKATSSHGSKAQRAGLMLVAYERDQFRHLKGTNLVLEAALLRFPKVKPYDLVDAAYWSWAALNVSKHRTKTRTAVGVSIASSLN